jgi:hypothetical protein
MTQPTDSRPLFVVGDIHGHFTEMKRLLRDAGLINASLGWEGGDARVWFMGDFFDRGPDGISSLALAMRMQEEAAGAGGEVDALIGNHDLYMLSVPRFPKDERFKAAWLRNGGIEDEVVKLTPDMTEWLMGRPLMAHADDYLLIHADAAFYPLFGTSIDDVNANFNEIVRSKDTRSWEYILDLFNEHRTFARGLPGIGRAQYILNLYGGSKIVHGHTPIHDIYDIEPEVITEPLDYAGGLALDVDGSIYDGGSGFAWRLK